ncbi:MAG: hypothetical protein EBY10_05545, partial [Actinobacteria bacterium]|nr:hypothetical protein [Actinomycetota bacterium]
TNTIQGITTFLNTGTLTFGNNGTSNFAAGLTASSPSSVNIYGTVKTTNTTLLIGSPINLTGNSTISGNTLGNITLSGTINGGYTLDLNTTGTTTLSGTVGATTALTSLTTNTGGTTAINGGSVKTTGVQTYNDAVTLGADTTLTTTGSAITFASTVDSSSGAKNLTFATGTGTATFTGAVGGTTALGTITNASGQQLTFSDAVTATTIANYGTLLFQASSAKTVSANITDNDTTTIQVINSADGAPGIITFSGNVAADTITIGTTSKAGSALFNGTVLQGAGTTNIAIVGGDVSGEASLGNFANTVTVTAITLDDNTGTASVTFSGTGKTITGTINGLAATEGTITVSGTPTFVSTIGNSQRPSQLTINGATTFQAAVQT